MDPDLPRLHIILNLIQQSRNILVILRLRLCQPRILPHAFQALPPADLNRKRCHTGDLSGIRLPAGERKHIPQVKGRVPYGIRVKRHIMDR